MSSTLTWQLAIRYLKGKRSGNAVPLLSRISMTAIAVGSGAMIILFSVFNGFEDLVKDLYKAFYPEIRVTAAKGKFFSLNDKQVAAIKHIKGVDSLSFVLEDNVLLHSDQDQRAAVIKGIDDNYFKVNNVDPFITLGDHNVSVDTSGTTGTAIIGEKLADMMGLDVKNHINSISLYYPNAKLQHPTMDMANAFQVLTLYPRGMFRVQDEFDDKYILAPISLVRQLFNEDSRYSSIEIKVAENGSFADVKQQIENITGTAYKTQTRYEQNKATYSVMNAERWVMYAILVFVLIIASSNMVGALSLLVLEKEKDMAILRAMGAHRKTIRNVFLGEGLLWSLIGGGIGIVLGTVICLLQIQFHLVKLGPDFMIDAFPVKMAFTDFILVIATIVFVGVLASWYPAQRAKRIVIFDLKSN